MRILGLTLFLATAGCGHVNMYGTVVAKLNQTDANICMLPNQVSVGQKVALYKHDCFIPPDGSTCRQVEIGEGTVIGLLGDHYATARFPKGGFREGNTVEVEK